MPMFDITKWFRKPQAGRRPIPGVEARSDSTANPLSSDSLANALRSDLEGIWQRQFGMNHPPPSIQPPTANVPPRPPPSRPPQPTTRNMAARMLVPRFEWDEMGDREATVSINRVVNRVVSNGSVVVSNGEVWINGQQVQIAQNVRNITIEIAGNINDLQVDACNSVSVHGNVGTIRTGSGNVNVTGNVDRDVQTGSGEIEVGENVGGNVTTGSGDVSATSINGAVRTASGDITGGGIRHVQY